MTGAEAPINAVAAGVAGPLSGDLQENPGPGALPSEDGQPCWADGFVKTFVLSCKVLEIANAPHAASRLDDDEKSTIAISDSGHLNDLQTIVSGCSLYSVALSSQKPEADVCKVLEIGNPTMAAGRLDDEEKSTLSSIEGAKINGLAKGAANRLKPCEKMTLSQAEGHSGKRLRLALKQAKRIPSAWRMELPAAETLTST